MRWLQRFWQSLCGWPATALRCTPSLSPSAASISCCCELGRPCLPRPLCHCCAGQTLHQYGYIQMIDISLSHANRVMQALSSSEAENYGYVEEFDSLDLKKTRSRFICHKKMDCPVLKIRYRDRNWLEFKKRGHEILHDIKYTFWRCIAAQHRYSNKFVQRKRM